jgi:hypothetical protein
MNACQCDVARIAKYVEHVVKVKQETMTMIFAKVKEVAGQRLGNLQRDQSKDQTMRGLVFKGKL